MSEVNKELVRRHFDEIWNHRNLAACDELMAQDFVENAAAPFAHESPGRVNGPAAMRGTGEWLTTQSQTCGWSWSRLSPRVTSSSHGSLAVARTSARLTGDLPPLERHSQRVKVTGFESPTANSVNTGPREMTCQLCCNLG